MTDTIAIAAGAQMFLDRGALEHYVDGQWRPSADGSVFEVTNPSTGSLLARCADAGGEEIDAAVGAAKAAFAAWSHMLPNERAVLMHRLADRIEQEAKTIAELEALDVGKVFAAAEGFDVPFSVQGIRYFADLSTNVAYDVPIALAGIDARTHLAPHGPCGFILPWNFPFLLLWWNIAPALAAGNTVVVKPSNITPLTTTYAAMLADEIGLPPGVINVVNGSGTVAGKALSNHPAIRHMAFTGSPEIGKLIGAAAGAHPIPCKLELGGKGAAVLFDDIDASAAAHALAGAITLNAGQVCCTATRWIVHEHIFDEFVDAVVEALRVVRVGHALDPESGMGPLVSQVQKERVLGYLAKGKQQGATEVLAGGLTAVPGYEDGFYVTPHLLAGSADNVCFREEVFGPTAFLTRFKHEDEAVEAVNSISYGLANSVWSQDLNRADRVAQRMIAGNSWLNAHNVFAYGLPYGGVNLSGMGGGVNSPHTFYDYLRRQTIARPTA